MTWRSRLSALLAASAALAALGVPHVGAVPTLLRQDPIPADGAVPAGGEVVHSWALAPAADPDDPAQAGSRSFFSYELEPGAVIEDAVTLFNLGTVPLTFDLYGTDARNNDRGDFELLPAATQPTGVGAWVETAASLGTVPAGGQLHIPITIRVPVDARPGDHAGAVLAASDTRATGPDGQEVVLDRRTGPRIYVRVAGELVPELSVEGLETSYDPALNPLGGGASVRYRIHNTGNVRLSGRHQASVAGPFGAGRQRGERLDLPELLPGESIEVETTVEGVPALGWARAEVVVEPSTELGEDPDLAPVSSRGMALAPPITVILGGVAAACGLFARRSLRRRRGPLPLEPLAS